MRWRICGIVSLGTLGTLGLWASALPARAAESLTQGPGGAVAWHFNWGGSYRVSGTGLSDMRVDAAGHLYGQHELIAHRLRFLPSMAMGQTLKLKAEVQLASGYLAAQGPNARFVGFGPPRDSSAGAGTDFGHQIMLRQLYGAWRTPVGEVLLGRMTSDWGLGLLANSGDHENEDWGSPELGSDRNYGDVVDRVLFATKPLMALSNARWADRWLAAVGADLVERDDLGQLAAGDRSLEGIGVLRYAHAKNNLGAYIAYRDMRDRNSDRLQVWALDLAGRGGLRLGRVRLYGAGEIAWVTGTTTIGRNAAYPKGPIGVEQLGYVARAGVTYLPWNVGGDVELGYASGDSNPNDNKLRNFTFDPNYHPSLILFDELMAAQTVASVANASDPARFGYPEQSLQHLPTAGAVTNAIYLRPTVRYRWNDSLRARLAVLWAQSEEDVVDPYNSNIAGGVARNYQGGNGHNRDLGVELDAGVDYTYRWKHWVAVTAGVQAGRLWPGRAFANAAGSRPAPINLLFGRLILKWLPPAPAAVH